MYTLNQILENEKKIQNSVKPIRVHLWIKYLVALIVADDQIVLTQEPEKMSYMMRQLQI